MEKIYEIYENYRIFDENDNFLTDKVCDYCKKPSELYIGLEGNLFICKGCLYDFINNLDDEFLKYIKKTARK